MQNKIIMVTKKNNYKNNLGTRCKLRDRYTYYGVLQDYK